MSYRLIDANAIAVLWPESNDMPCIYADLPSGLDGGHYDMRESDKLQRENTKLRELVAKMARALGVDSEWCHRECAREFGCDCEPCPLDQALLELGIEVDG